MSELLKYINTKMYKGSLEKIIKNIYNRHYVINVKNKEENDIALDIFESAGIKKYNDLRNASFNIYGETLCYRIEYMDFKDEEYRICFSDKEYYISKGYGVMSLQYLINHGLEE
jgi:hypothetical protein